MNIKGRRKDAYLRRVARVLGACQLVEDELKNCITDAHKLTHKCAGGRGQPELKKRNYKKESLGGLTKAFAKLCDCPALIERLDIFREERNFVAHGAIKKCIDPDGELDYIESRSALSHLAKIEKEAIQLTKAINEEALKFRARLDFFDLDGDRTPVRRS